MKTCKMSFVDHNTHNLKVIRCYYLELKAQSKENQGFLKVALFNVIIENEIISVYKYDIV